MKARKNGILADEGSKSKHVGIALNVTPPTAYAKALSMRTTHDEVSVRLYHLSDGPEGGAAETLFYGPLHRALDMAAAQPEEVQEGLFIATDNDVVAYLDLIGE